jgi:hypothetical protein
MRGALWILAVATILVLVSAENHVKAEEAQVADVPKDADSGMPHAAIPDTHAKIRSSDEEVKAR